MQTSADDPGQNGTMVQSLGLLFFLGLDNTRSM